MRLSAIAIFFIAMLIALLGMHIQPAHASFPATAALHDTLDAKTPPPANPELLGIGAALVHRGTISLSRRSDPSTLPAALLLGSTRLSPWQNSLAALAPRNPTETAPPVPFFSMPLLN